LVQTGSGPGGGTAEHYLRFQDIKLELLRAERDWDTAPTLCLNFMCRSQNGRRLVFVSYWPRHRQVPGYQNPGYPHDPADGSFLTRRNPPGWSATQIHQAILSRFQLSANHYGLPQLRYDLRKMKAHDLVQRDGHHYTYRLTDKGVKVALLFLFFHKRLCGPLANSLFHHRPHGKAHPKFHWKPLITKPMTPSKKSSIS
jgi:hypothetical protein